MFSGNYCETCSNCDNLCDLYKDCVTCTIMGSCNGTECHPTDISKVEMVDSLEGMYLHFTGPILSCLYNSKSSMCNSLYSTYIYPYPSRQYPIFYNGTYTLKKP